VALNVSGAGAGEAVTRGADAVTGAAAGQGDGGSAGLYLYPLPVWIATLVGSFASALLISGIGTFISLRSETVRAAHQAMMLPLFILIFGGSFGIGALWRALPEETRVSLFQWASGVSALEAMIGIVTLLVLVDAFLLRLGVRRFRRSRLIAG
jgi:hypothetical protein